MRFFLPIVAVFLIAGVLWNRQTISREMQSVPGEAQMIRRAPSPPSAPIARSENKPSTPVESVSMVVSDTSSWKAPDDGEKELEKEPEDPEHAYYRDTEFLSLDGRSRYFLSKEEVKERFPYGLPQEINMTENGVHTRFFHPNGKGSGAGQGKTMYVADRASVEQRAEAMRERQRLYEPDPAEVAKIKKEKKLKPVAKDAFWPTFQPGLKGIYRDNVKGTVYAPDPAEVFRRIREVDFNLSIKTENDIPTPEEIALITSSVVSLGHGGTMILEVSGDVGLEAGFEWTIYENAFDIDPENREHPGDKLYFELAKVSVSSDGKEYRELPCDTDNPINNRASFCAGTIPTYLGGDLFDLQMVPNGYELQTIKFIKITDTNTNYEKTYRGNASGFDLDAVELKKVFIRSQK